MSEVLTKIQGLQTHLNEQKAEIGKLARFLQDVSGVEGPSEYQEAGESNSDYFYSACARYRISVEKAVLLIQGECSWVSSTFERMQGERNFGVFSTVIEDAALLYVNGVAGFDSIVATRSEMNKPEDVFPPVLPQDLAELTPPMFDKIVDQHKERLKLLKNTLEMELKDEFRNLSRDSKHSEPQQVNGKDIVVQDLLKQRKGIQCSFERGWKIFKDVYPLLCIFAGGLVSVFPGTSTVESDFSVIGFQKDDYKAALTDFSLESCLQSKQIKDLEQLSNNLKQKMNGYFESF